MAMFRIKRIDHVVLRVRQPQVMLRFYTEVLGCSVERIRDDLGLFHLRAGDSLIDLVALDGKLGRAGGAGPGAEGRNVDHVCLSIEPFDGPALTAWLLQHGAGPGTVEQRFGAEGPSIYLRDPEGNGVELKG